MVASRFIRSTFVKDSRIGPEVLMRGPIRLPCSISFFHRAINSKSPPISRTLVTPLAMKSGSVFSPLGDSRPWMLAPYEWEAPATRHLPLLFEDPNLERLGYTCGGRISWCGEERSLHTGRCLQPFLSAAHFFGRVPMIPYLCGVDHPCEPIYTLGVDRTGSPVPYRRHFIPLSLRGALYQAGVSVGLVYAIP